MGESRFGMNGQDRLEWYQGRTAFEDWREAASALCFAKCLRVQEVQSREKRIKMTPLVLLVSIGSGNKLGDISDLSHNKILTVSGLNETFGNLYP